jgi:hypothetical protein
MGFAVIHEETIGWDATTKLPLVESFPHKAILSTGADMQKLNADATYADIEVRRQQEEQNQAEADIREAQKNQFKMRLKGGLFGSKK